MQYEVPCIHVRWVSNGCPMCSYPCSMESPAVQVLQHVQSQNSYMDEVPMQYEVPCIHVRWVSNGCPMCSYHVVWSPLNPLGGMVGSVSLQRTITSVRHVSDMGETYVYAHLHQFRDAKVCNKASLLVIAEDVARLEIPNNDILLMELTNSAADLLGDVNSLLNAHWLLVTPLSDGYPTGCPRGVIWVSDLYQMGATWVPHGLPVHSQAP